MAVVIRRMGRISYLSSLNVQKEIVERYKEKKLDRMGEILLCEHEPVYTFGLREKDYHKHAAALSKTGATVVKTSRGGQTTFHGPGQLVCYPILNLHKLKLDVRRYIFWLEQSVIDSVNEFGVMATRSEYTGVWVGDNKLCAIGIQISKGVTYHGLALNCTTDLSWFNHIVPCGIYDKGVTSLTKLIGREVSVCDASAALVKHLVQNFNLSISKIS